GEVERLAVLWRDRETCNQRVALTVRERTRRLLPRPGLDGARHLELFAKRPRQVDVEPDQLSVRVAVVERRKVRRGEKADRRHGRKVGRNLARARIDMIRQGLAGRAA